MAVHATLLIFLVTLTLLRAQIVSVLQLTKAILGLYIDGEKRREKEESKVRQGLN